MSEAATAALESPAAEAPPAPAASAVPAVRSGPSGVERAAIVLLSVGEEVGAEVLTHLDDAEIKKVSAAMVQLEALTAQAVTDTIETFFESMNGYTFNMGGMEQTERLLRKALPEEMVKLIMREVSTRHGVDIWRKLSSVDRNLLVAYLRGEHPQTVALVLSQVGPEAASKLLKSFDRKLANEVIMRMLRMQPVQTEALTSVEEALRIDFLVATANRRQTDTHASMAEIFNNFDSRTGAELMDDLSKVNERSAQKIANLMFTFKDLVKLDPASMQTMIQALDKEVITRALNGETEVIKMLFVSNMSSRSAKRLEDDILAQAGKLSRAEIEEAQSAILKTTKSLIDRGDIRIFNERSDEGGEEL